MSKCPNCSTDLGLPSHFCPACGSSLGSLSESDSMLETRAFGADSAGAGPSLAGAADSDARRPSSSSLDTGGFAPGTTFAGRYRIAGLLGRGGMGEVYRADDLKLAHPVALKFLPPALAQDAGRLERFYNEVRIARQVSHPNVCRVYDLVEFEGRTCLSMEYVDGEDLSSLLRRIGRLPEDKAVDVARQLCAGLAAAHDKGVLHRDLKPGNVMLDGRGKVRVTDFGLAVLVQDQAVGGRGGTPAYMAPEQLARNETSVQSDLYALGLVLYEIFTGKRTFQAVTLAELTRQHLESAPASPSSLVQELDPTIERAILRCLEKEPRDRPASALAVAAALPGGDPLAAALAAGETPSPEMVAAAGATGGLRPAVAWACLAVFAAGLVGVVQLSQRLGLVNRVPLEKAPAVLVDRASDILRKLGYASTPADRQFGFGTQEDYLRWVTKNDRSPGRWRDLESGRPNAIYFWYRESPQHMEPLRPAPLVSLQDPPPVRAGMASVLLDPSGRLLELQVVPPQREDSTRAASGDPDWGVLLGEAGLDPAGLAPVAPRWLPPVYADRRAAWEGAYPNRAPLRVEAGAYAGKPVYFRTLGPWSRAERPGESNEGEQSTVAQVINTLLILLLLIGSVLQARRNLHQGRGDRRGASRLATYTLALYVVVWFLLADHAATIQGEFGLFIPAFSIALFVSGLLWVVYVALEPIVRRRWPDSVIAWSRFLGGKFRDPLIGRDVLIGCFCGILLAGSPGLCYYIVQWFGKPPPQPFAESLLSLRGIPSIVGQFLEIQPGAVLLPMALLFLLILLRVVLRLQVLAVVALIAIFAPLFRLQGGYLAADIVTGILVLSIFLFLLLRLGLLAAMAANFVSSLLTVMPLTTRFSAWYAPSAMFALAVVSGLALYGFFTATAGRPLLKGSLFQD